jgi:hypothetical protein
MAMKASEQKDRILACVSNPGYPCRHEEQTLHEVGPDKKRVGAGFAFTAPRAEAPEAVPSI